MCVVHEFMAMVVDRRRLMQPEKSKYIWVIVLRFPPILTRQKKRNLAFTKLWCYNVTFKGFTWESSMGRERKRRFITGLRLSEAERQIEKAARPLMVAGSQCPHLLLRDSIIFITEHLRCCFNFFLQSLLVIVYIIFKNVMNLKKERQRSRQRSFGSHCKASLVWIDGYMCNGRWNKERERVKRVVT